MSPTLRRADSEKIPQKAVEIHDRVHDCTRLNVAGVCVRARSLILPQLWVMKLVSNTCAFQVSIYFDRTRLKANLISAGKTGSHK
jgi:hypothetical protein